MATIARIRRTCLLFGAHHPEHAEIGDRHQQKRKPDIFELPPGVKDRAADDNQIEAPARGSQDECEIDGKEDEEDRRAKEHDLVIVEPLTEARVDDHNATSSQSLDGLGRCRRDRLHGQHRKDRVRHQSWPNALGCGSPGIAHNLRRAAKQRRQQIDVRVAVVSAISRMMSCTKPNL